MTGKIGPHEGQEIALMRAGKKHVAKFGEQIFFQEEAYAELLNGDDFDEIYWDDISVFESKVFFIPNWIIFRKSHEVDAIELMERAIYIKFWNEFNERRIGEILGYAQDDIDAFIAQLKRNGHIKW